MLLSARLVVLTSPAITGPVGVQLHTQHWQHWPLQRRETAAGASRKDDGLLSRLEMEVPSDQRPVNELNQLKGSALYSWATLDVAEYAKRLLALWAGVFALLGGPIAFQTFDPADQGLEFFLSASTGSLLVVAAASLRIYLGWKYVADRLMTATLEYEETGWYDGQFFVKPPEILTRDRLLGAYEVRPVMARLRRTLLFTGVALLATAAALTVAIRSGTDSDGAYGRFSDRPKPAQVSRDGTPIFSSKVQRVEDLLSDDVAAAAEAEALGGVPGYCNDRYFKTVAGGEAVCDRLERQRRAPSPSS